MITSFRIGLIAGLAGVLLLVYGVKQFRLTMGASSLPVATDLARLEQGESAPDRHLAFGEHMKLYGGLIYEYELERGTTEPTASTPLNYCYYPIISTSHPTLRMWTDLANVYGDLSRVPDHEAPELDRIAVLVKTREFKTVGEVERLERWQKGLSLSGLVVNRIETLGAPERRLLRSAFPRLDLGRVILLDAGRLPGSALAISLVCGLGLALLGLAGWLLLVKTVERQVELRPVSASTRRRSQRRESPGTAATDSSAPHDPAREWFESREKQSNLTH